MQPQIIIIKGGSVFDSYQEYISSLTSLELTKDSFNRKSWADNIQKELSDYEVLIPEMPSKQNSKYLEWKIWFEKVIELANDEVILVGRSLGGIFLVKYLSENTVTKKIKQLHLIGTPYDNNGTDQSLGDFVLQHPIISIEQKVDTICMYFSTDDPVVPFANYEKYKKELPSAKFFIYDNKRHFNQEHFPELVENIMKL